MTLQEKIIADMRSTGFMRELFEVGDGRMLRVIVGELQRQPKKKLTDDEVVRILKKLHSAEKELITLKGETISPFLTLLETYLPEEVTRDQIIDWIIKNVDFSGLKTKMQAIGLVTKHFGAAVDGNTVRNIILNRF